MNNKMHQFTIDYLTKKAKTEKLCADGAMSYGIYNKNDSADDGYFSRRSSRQTPSPSDSGMESDNSPGKCDGKKNEEDESAIVDVSFFVLLFFYTANLVNNYSKTTDYTVLLFKLSYEVVYFVVLMILNYTTRIYGNNEMFCNG